MAPNPLGSVSGTSPAGLRRWAAVVGLSLVLPPSRPPDCPPLQASSYRDTWVQRRQHGACGALPCCGGDCQALRTRTFRVFSPAGQLLTADTVKTRAGCRVYLLGVRREIYYFMRAAGLPGV
ncbi:hypothetical protein ISCGN_005288 [Ixodes scapularis]